MAAATFRSPWALINPTDGPLFNRRSLAILPVPLKPRTSRRGHPSRLPQNQAVPVHRTSVDDLVAVHVLRRLRP